MNRKSLGTGSFRTGRETEPVDFSPDRNKKAAEIRIWILRISALMILLSLWLIPWLKRPVVSQNSFENIVSAVLAVNDPNDYPQRSDQTIRKLLNLNDQDYAQIGFYRQDDAFSAKEIVIAKFDNPQQSEKLTHQLEERKRSQIEIYSGYAPEQQAMMEQAILDVQGNYILFYTGDHPEQSDQAFLEALRRNE